MTSRLDPSSPPAVPSVLILCADDAVAAKLVRELVGRRYQPLVGRPDWSLESALEWAHPAAAVVDAQHPAARSEELFAGSGDREVGLVVFGEPAVTETAPRAQLRSDVATVPGADPGAICGAVDAKIRRTRQTR